MAIDTRLLTGDTGITVDLAHPETGETVTVDLRIPWDGYARIEETFGSVIGLLDAAGMVPTTPEGKAYGIGGGKHHRLATVGLWCLLSHEKYTVEDLKRMVPPGQVAAIAAAVTTAVMHQQIALARAPEDAPVPDTPATPGVVRPPARPRNPTETG